MGNRIYLILLFSFLQSLNSFAQKDLKQYSLLFYNVENLFDLKDNPETEDDNFTPDGELHWTQKKLNQKLVNISKVVLNAGGWKAPEIILLCEIENREVLDQLLKNTPLNTIPYRIIHKESPDHRGIDVAMIYNQKLFYPLGYQYYPLIVNGKLLKTREIMYVMGILDGKDTVHIFGNHWPSRYSGFLETKSLRNTAANLLKSKVHELNQKYGSPKIIITGDFNDNPEDESLAKILGARKVEPPISDTILYNLFIDAERANAGSLKYQSQWFIFDQIIVSGALLKNKPGVFVRPGDAKIVMLPFLLEKDEKFGGKKPFRTYNGFSYHGGFSDHLPVLLQLNCAD